MVKIVKAYTREKYQLVLELENSNILRVHFGDKLNTVRFGKFKDIDFFDCVKTEGYTVSWGNEIQMSLEEIIDMIRK